MTRTPSARLLAALERAPGGIGAIESAKPIGGGDTHGALVVRAAGNNWFVKWGDAGALPLFEAEHHGLVTLAASNGPRVPRARGTGGNDRHSWLIVEYFDLRGSGNTTDLGRSLAALHRTIGPAHGFEAANYIGRSAQRNDWTTCWAEFWWDCRLLPQLRFAEERGVGDDLAPLASSLESACRILLDHRPPPSLLHGDLWSGNHGFLDDGEPVIFDPACHYGDRETDIAMMRLFGGFDRGVLRAYETAWSLPAGHERRLALYQLYHVLNHLNLFGAAWLGRAETLARAVLESAGIRSRG